MALQAESLEKAGSQVEQALGTEKLIVYSWASDQLFKALKNDSVYQGPWKEFLMENGGTDLFPLLIA